MLMEYGMRMSQTSEKPEIGKNLSILPARLNKNLEIFEGVTIERLLKFKDNEIKNLYSFDPITNVFKLDHQDGDYLARATAMLNPYGIRFKVEYLDDHMTEFGISYIGVLRVQHMNGVFLVKIPGELSYDPASLPGDTLWVDFYQVAKIIVFVSVIVKATLLGATKKFIRRIYNVLKPIISRYYLKEELFRWMYKQVKYSCIYKKQQIPYALHLQSKSHKYSDNIQNYLSNLEILKKGEIQELLPPPEYFKGISEEKSSEVSSKLKVNETFSLKMFSSETGEEPFVPTVKELTENLQKIREKYERELERQFERISELEKKKSIFPDFHPSISSSFTEKCPIF